MIFGCAQRGDNHNPLGLTGGSEGGYGKRQSDYYYNSRIQQNVDSVEGIWTDADETMTINSDGTFEIKSSEEIQTGTFTKDKENLTLNFKDGYSIKYKYSFENKKLKLTEIE
jgi:hypothetical protein